MRLASAVLVLVIVSGFVPLAGAIGGNPIQGPLRLTGCHGFLRAGSTCTYTVTSSDPAIVFFRWDFDDDGVYDFPNQAGAGIGGKWTPLTQVTWMFVHCGVYPVCVQGWDGVTWGPSGPIAPIACLPPGPPPGAIR